VSSTPPPTLLADDAAHILVVDDDRRLRALLSSYLVKHGHRVTVAPTAAKARAFLEGLAFDIIVLDVMMPVENGFDFAADLRTRSQVPILMLTARGESQDRVRGLEIGVDDYLTKPFEPRELLLRIGSVLRRTRALPAGDDPIRITEREREMLRLLSANPGAIVSREALSGSDGAAQERTVDVLVNRLRRKIEQDPTNPVYLQTARGAGYRLVADR
jgi:two-component system, OmpR family, phosphate regulon response regulator OmpR